VGKAITRTGTATNEGASAPTKFAPMLANDGGHAASAPLSTLRNPPAVIASEAKQSTSPLAAPWIASSLALLAMTVAP
jgi:hypothetical protein